jgi:hypothetical protein
MEATLLGRAGTNAAAVMRLPRVLTAERLCEVRSGDDSAMFDLLETEAVRLLMEMVAGSFRGIYVPAPWREFSLGTARAAVASEPVSAGATPGPLPVFPSEHLDECGMDGARRVLGPLFPAAEPFRRIAVAGPTQAGRAEREDWLRAVASQLYHVSTRDDTLSTDGSVKR